MTESKIIQTRVATGVCGLIALLFGATAQAEPYGVNLLANTRNGNAEQGQASPSGPPGLPVPSWSTNGYFTVVPYGSQGQPAGFPSASDSGPPDRGNQFFSGGTGPVAVATQEIDLSANAADIAGGKVIADLSAWLGGSGGVQDYATVAIGFYSGNNDAGGSGELAPISAADRSNKSGLLPRLKSFAVPANATRLVINIVITRVTQPSQFDPNPYNYGCADSLSLILRKPVVVTTTADSGSGSLRAAIPMGSYITFDPDVFSPAGAPHYIVLASPLQINASTTITGPGVNLAAIVRNTGAGAPEFNLINVGTYGGDTLQLISGTFSGLGFYDGLAKDSGGGGIKCFADCTMTACTFAGNYGNIGGAIYSSDGSVTLDSCTFFGNAASSGGALTAASRVPKNSTIQNCTFVGNSDRGQGAIWVVSRNSFKISNCTITGAAVSITTEAATVHVDNNIFATDSGTFSGGGVISDGFNLSSRDDSAVLKANGDRNNTDPMLGPLQDNGGPTQTRAPLPGSLAIDKGNSSLTSDQRGFPRPVDDPASGNGAGNNSDIGAVEVQPAPSPSPTPTPTPLPALLAQISTRLRVEGGDNALFGGFIITGSQTKRLMIRAIGPTVPVVGNLQNPTLELYNGSARIAFNDNWIDAANKQEISDSGIAPKSDMESSILTSLAPGAYSAIVRGLNDTTGVGLVEVYDLDQAANSKLAQISTRGYVQTGDNAMFGGFFVSNGSQKVIIRAIGPSTGLGGALQDPTLELHDGNGALMTANDNWVDSPDKQAIIDSTVAPKSDFESAIVRSLAPGPYSAIVRGVNNSVGIALVEVYALN